MELKTMSASKPRDHPSAENNVVLNALQDVGHSDIEGKGNFGVPVHHLSLPILAPEYEMKENMSECMKRNARAFLLLKISANFWPDVTDNDDGLTENWKWYHKIVFVSARASLVALFITYVTLSFGLPPSVFDIAIIITIILDTVSVLPAQYSNQQRLRQSARIQDASVVDEGSKIALGWGITFYISAVVFLINYLGTYTGVWGFLPFLYLFIFTVGEFALCGYLMFNLFVLLMDIKVSSLSIDQLFILAENRSLTMATFTRVRADIHRRVSVSRWASDLIIVPCIPSVIAILVIFTDNKLDIYNFVLVLIKELLYVGVAFWYVAQVNEKADKLTRKLSEAMWDGQGGVSDAERLSILTSAMLEPISFTLLFKRLSIQNVALSFAGCAVSIVVGIIKQAVLAG